MKSKTVLEKVRKGGDFAVKMIEILENRIKELEEENKKCLKLINLLHSKKFTTVKQCDSLIRSYGVLNPKENETYCPV